jgi:hypothetical protein
MLSDKKVIIAYLYTKFDVPENLINFLHHHKINYPGYDYKLLICFKLLAKKEINSLRKITSMIDHIEFIDPNKLNDFDFGSYKRIAEKFPNNPIFFTLGHSYPVSKNWLKKIMLHFNKKTFIGTSVSNESLYSSFIKKKGFKTIFNLFNFFFFKKNFHPLPNPHIRTINFILYGHEYLNFAKNKQFHNKKDAWICESGFSGMTNYYKNKKFIIMTVNSEGKSFTSENFKQSETYCFKKQAKQLFSDKHSRKYDHLNEIEKLKISNNVWG